MSDVDWWARMVALWGAALSTALAIIQFRKDRPRLRVTVSQMAALPLPRNNPADPLILVKITNIGRRNVTVKGIVLRRGKDEFVMTQYKHLPKLLEPTQEIGELYGTNFVSLDTREVAVFDTEGREWRVKRKMLESIRRNLHQAPL